MRWWTCAIGISDRQPIPAGDSDISGNKRIRPDGNVTSLADNGGKLLQHARIVLVFWGSAWASSSTAPSQPAARCSSSGVIPGRRSTGTAHTSCSPRPGRAGYQNTGRPGWPIQLRSCDLLHIAVHSLWVKVPGGVARTAWQYPAPETAVRRGLSAGSQRRAGFPARQIRFAPPAVLRLPVVMPYLQ